MLFYGDNDSVTEERIMGGEGYEKEVDEFGVELDALVQEHGLYEGWRRAYGFPCPWEQMEGLTAGSLATIHMTDGEFSVFTVPEKDLFPDPMVRYVPDLYRRRAE